MSDMTEKSEKGEKTDRYEMARKIAVRKVEFIRHAAIYLVVMAVLALINNTTGGGYQWWLWPALGWGIGVVSHFLSAFVSSSGGLVERVTKRELEKMDDKE